MYNNIGEKLKAASRTVSGIGFFIALVEMAVIWYLLSEAGSGTAGFFAGLVFGGITYFTIWLSTLLLYGFGQLVSNSDELVEMKKQEQRKKSGEKKPRTQTKSAKEMNETEDTPADVENAPYWCQVCDHPGPYEGDCPNCGSDIKVYPHKD